MVPRNIIGTALALLKFQQCAGSEAKYGVDVSFPIHYGFSDDLSAQVKDKQTLYDDFLNGCREFSKNDPDSCNVTERERLEMNVRQPQSMKNYTDTGFTKVRAPDAVMKLLTEHWERNKDKKTKEVWPAGNTYTNHWASQSYLVSTNNGVLRGGGDRLESAVWEAVRKTIEEWTGMEQKPVSQYGIRVYTEGSILAPHVDRLPLVSSCIINVDQDVDEDWPIEVYDREGKAVNITMKPGDMVLYESHSLIHGRPFPLKGRYFANIFIHFEPTGHSLRPDIEDYDEQDLPPYVLRDSPEETKYRKDNPNGWHEEDSEDEATPAHEAADAGDIDELEKIAREQGHLLHEKDINGWQPIHEAARAGHVDIVEKLISYGADMNGRTHHGEGPTPLFLAIENHGEDHPVTLYLKSLGALDMGPEL